GLEVDAEWGRVVEGVVSEGGGPFQDPVCELLYSPGRELLHAVVSLTQVRKVSDIGRAAQRGIDGVVDFATDGGQAASGEPAVLIPGPEVPVDRGGAVVGVDVQYGPGDRVGEGPLQR